MSSASVTNMMNQTQGLSSSSMRIEEETMLMMMQKENQGIVTILGSGCCDTYTTSSASSLRRTFSADMSSKNWLSHNNSNKTISTSSSSSSSEGEEEYEAMKKKEFDADAEAEAEAERERLEIWSSILRNKKEEQEKSSSPFDTWGTIMNLKGNNEISKSLPLTPYVHPLVKRSKSSLNQKSLEICTESLGSETGSDGMLFSSSYPSSESEDNKDREQQQEEEIVKVNESTYEAEQDWYNNHHAITTKKSSPPRSFPPPLPSLSLQANNKNGASLHMRPHRDNGRLVLEAVSLPSQNNFNAQRQDGRLVLTFTDGPAAAAAYDDMAEENYDIDEGVEDLEEEFEGFQEEDGGDYDDDDVEVEDEDEEEEEEGVEVVNVESVMMEKESSNLLSSNVHRLTLMMNKSIGRVKNNRNQNWSEKFNKKGVNLEEVSLVKMEPTSAVAQSLTQTVGRLIPSSASAATSFNFNAYEYYWRTNPTTTEAESDYKAIHNQHNSNYYPSSQHHNKMNNYGSKVIVSTNEHQHQQQLLVLRGKNGDYLVHNLKTCKDSRRPFLFWEPYCIATS